MILKPSKQLELLQSIRPTPEQVLGAVGLASRLPVDPFEVAQRLGINCLGATSSDIAQAMRKTGPVTIEGVSFLHEADKTYWIVFGSDWPENAKRFTVAHELGHVILHKEQLPLNRERANRRTLEGEANRFAAGLLMPDTLIRKYVTLSPSVVARAFRVSPRAAEIRLCDVT